MPIYSIVFFARTENVQSIIIPQQSTLYFQIQCGSCHEKFPKQVGVFRNEEVEMQKQHGLANFSAKCKNCQRKCYITILKSSTYTATADEHGMIKEIVANVSKPFALMIFSQFVLGAATLSFTMLISVIFGVSTTKEYRLSPKFRNSLSKSSSLKKSDSLK